VLPLQHGLDLRCQHRDRFVLRRDHGMQTLHERLLTGLIGARAASMLNPS
jgi:hypothetical protein